MELVQQAQLYIETQVKSLKGDEDYPPFIVVTDHKGVSRVSQLEMPDDPELRDVLAASLSAVCVAFRATEAVFSSVGWMAPPNGGTPSENPDRAEVVLVLSAKADPSKTGGEEPGVETSFRTANLIRDNNLVGVGLWEKDGETVADGRFLKALKVGLQYVQMLPPEFIEHIDKRIAAGEEGQLIEMITKAFVATQVFTDRLTDILEGMENDDVLRDLGGYGK